jgi:hypothetical protein
MGLSDVEVVMMMVVVNLHGPSPSLVAVKLVSHAALTNLSPESLPRLKLLYAERHRQREEERAAFAHRALHPDSAAMALHDAACDR